MNDQSTTVREDAAAGVLDALAAGLARAARTPVLRTPADAGLAYEELSFPSADGVPLEAWYMPHAHSDRLVVSAHAFGFSRAGFPGHLEPWRSAFGAGNDTEVDLTADYAVLHEAGYHVLAFDFRNHGLSGDANGGLQSNNRFEARDVVGALAYVRADPRLARLQTAVFARCMGANATFRAAHEHPEAFADVACLVAPLLMSSRVFAATALAAAGLGGRLDEVDRRFQRVTGVSLAGADVGAWAPSVRVPTLTYGVLEDHLTQPGDLADAFAAIGTADKEMFWIRDTPRRWDGYTWFQRHPESVLSWLDSHLS